MKLSFVDDYGTIQGHKIYILSITGLIAFVVLLKFLTFLCLRCYYSFCKKEDFNKDNKVTSSDLFSVISFNTLVHEYNATCMNIKTARKLYRETCNNIEFLQS